MDIHIRSNNQYREVILEESNTSIDLGLLDEKEAQQLAAEFISAAWCLVRHQFDSSDDYFQWVRDNT